MRFWILSLGRDYPSGCIDMGMVESYGLMNEFVRLISKQI